MTDKEMAEEYRKALKQRLIDEDNFERLEMFDENVEEAFLAGLKARLQWHDLRKDPNDLPKENTEVLIYCYGNVRQAFFRRFFKSLYGDCRVEEVIAWCELPTFDKE